MRAFLAKFADLWCDIVPVESRTTSFSHDFIINYNFTFRYTTNFDPSSHSTLLVDV